MKNKPPSKNAIAIAAHERRKIARRALRHARNWEAYATEMKEVTAWDSMQQGIGGARALRQFAQALKSGLL
jgi:hypothetical protein